MKNFQKNSTSTWFIIPQKVWQKNNSNTIILIRYTVRNFISLKCIIYLPLILYHKYSLSSSVACMRVTKKPALSLSVTSTRLFVVFILGGTFDNFKIGTTTTFNLAVWLFFGTPWSSAFIISSYSLSTSSVLTAYTKPVSASTRNLFFPLPDFME